MLEAYTGMYVASALNSVSLPLSIWRARTPLSRDTGSVWHIANHTSLSPEFTWYHLPIWMGTENARGRDSNPTCVFVARCGQLTTTPPACPSFCYKRYLSLEKDNLHASLITLAVVLTSSWNAEVRRVKRGMVWNASVLRPPPASDGEVLKTLTRPTDEPRRVEAPESESRMLHERFPAFNNMHTPKTRQLKYRHLVGCFLWYILVF